MPSTLKDIADRLGVTSATVSMVINNKPNISKATKDKVMAVAKELNYYPNLIARGLATNRTNAIGIIVPNLASSFVIRVMQGIKSSIEEKDYTVLLFDTTGHKESEMDVFNRVVMEGRVDGAIIITANAIDKELKLFSNENKPCILVAQKSSVVDSIYVNNEKSSKEGVLYLIENGHKNIAIVTNLNKPIIMEERINGYKKALTEKKITYNKRMTFSVEDDTISEGKKVASKILASNNTPTAIFCPAGDMAAIGIIKKLRENNISIPKDIAVMGYDDIPSAEVIEPALTTIRQPKLEMGDYAISMMIDKLENKVKGIKHKVLNAKLIVRDSA